MKYVLKVTNVRDLTLPDVVIEIECDTQHDAQVITQGYANNYGRARLYRYATWKDFFKSPLELVLIDDRTESV